MDIPRPSPAILNPGTPLTAPRLHGDLALWIFIFSELLVFAVFFAAYAFTRASNVELFNLEQAGLDRNGGAINTALLLSSSFFVVKALQSVEQQRNHSGARWLLAALGCGAGFVVIKVGEYVEKFDQGITLSSSIFHMFYLSLTFFHFMHVLLGMVILTALWKGVRTGRYSPGNMNGLESGAAYWHMVDLVWIILFPLVYVMH